MRNEIELLSCPCCKAKSYADKIGNPLFTIYCSNIKCGLKVSKPTFEEAVNVWNTRIPIDNIEKKLRKESKPLGFGLIPNARYISESEAIQIVRQEITNNKE